MSIPIFPIQSAVISLQLLSSPIFLFILVIVIERPPHIPYIFDLDIGRARPKVELRDFYRSDERWSLGRRKLGVENRDEVGR